jgi:ABC-type sulfate transport system permease component
VAPRLLATLGETGLLLLLLVLLLLLLVVVVAVNVVAVSSKLGKKELASCLASAAHAATAAVCNQPPSTPLAPVGSDQELPSRTKVSWSGRSAVRMESQRALLVARGVAG